MTEQKEIKYKGKIFKLLVLNVPQGEKETSKHHTQRLLDLTNDIWETIVLKIVKTV